LWWRVAWGWREVLVLSSVDYGLIAVIAFASSFFGAFGKELADLFIQYFRDLRKRKLSFWGRKN
jgi:hypothetical protein